MKIVLPGQDIDIQRDTGVDVQWYEKLQQITARANQVGQGLLATSATDGFGYLPTMAGAPSGVPLPHTGFVACVYDITNHKLWVYDTSVSAWRGVVLT